MQSFLVDRYVATIQHLSPKHLAAPVAPYSQAVRVKASEFLFIAGQVGARSDWSVPEDFDEQCDLTFANIRAILRECGADWGNVVQFTSYLVDPNDIEPFKSWRTRIFPEMFPNALFPPNALLIVSRLVSAKLRLEVQAIAAL
jgi:enamine deaminase RidA (YjgF/YER057c/UK114 family)